MSRIFTSENIEDLEKVAGEIIDSLGETRVVCIIGEMGAGKTTLVKKMIQFLGAHDLGNSPTFSIINTYESANNGKIFHLDLYRLESIDEAFDIGIEDVLYYNSWCFIEWPELVSSLLPEKYANLTINVESEEKRVFSLQLIDK